MKPRTTTRRLVTLSAVASLAMIAAVSAQAVTSESPQGSGMVTYVADGDTPYVNGHSVRLIAVQAPEVHHSGTGPTQCHATAAKAELKNLVGGKHVQLRSMYSSSANKGRPLRSVFVKQSGAWANVQRELLKGGYVFWFNQPTEWVHNKDYHLLTMQAAARGLRLWNTSFCGAGPYQKAVLKVYLHYHANGSDTKNLNGQWIEIANESPSMDVHLGGWHLRDSSLAWFTFPSHTFLPAGGSVTVHVGSGTNVNSASTKNFYWNQSAPLFGEVNRYKGIGDMAILLDPQDDYRAWTDYPCVLNCSDPLIGHLKIASWDYGAGGDREWIKLQSVGTSSRIWLGHYQVRSWPWNYVIKKGTYLDPGETLKIYTGGGGSASRLVQFMNESSKGILNGTGDQIDVSNMRDVQIDCVHWGSGSCSYNY